VGAVGKDRGKPSTTAMSTEQLQRRIIFLLTLVAKRVALFFSLLAAGGCAGRLRFFHPRFLAPNNVYS
jgi:hypothetical protein